MATKKSPQKAAQKQKPSLPNITASIDRLVPTEGDGVKALASITIGGHYAIHGFKVYESEEKGLSVLCPATKSEKNGKYYENSHPITAEAREDLNKARIRARISARDRRCKVFLRNFPIVAGLSGKYRYPVG